MRDFFEKCFINGFKIGKTETTKGFKIMVTNETLDNGILYDKEKVVSKLVLNIPYIVDYLVIS